MKAFIEKVFTQQAVSDEELFKFIADLCKLMEKPKPTVNEIQIISFLLKSGRFDIVKACKLAANKLDIKYIEIQDFKHDNSFIIFI